MNSQRVDTGNAIAVVSAIILVATEILFMAAVSGWAIAGLLNLADVLFWFLEGLMIVAALYGSYAFARRALKNF